MRHGKQHRILDSRSRYPLADKLVADTKTANIVMRLLRKGALTSGRETFSNPTAFII